VQRLNVVERSDAGRWEPIKVPEGNLRRDPSNRARDRRDDDRGEHGNGLAPGDDQNWPPLVLSLRPPDFTLPRHAHDHGATVAVWLPGLIGDHLATRTLDTGELRLRLGLPFICRHDRSPDSSPPMFVDESLEADPNGVRPAFDDGLPYEPVHRLGELIIDPCHDLRHPSSIAKRIALRYTSRHEPYRGISRSCGRTP
jgi:hypothetical protein